VWINDHIPLVSEMPHGGYKQSGYGKDLSTYSLEDYTQIKHVMAKIDRDRSEGLSLRHG
jgi:betaine-aldehyde dehydrogenase